MCDELCMVNHIIKYVHITKIVVHCTPSYMHLYHFIAGALRMSHCVCSKILGDSTHLLYAIIFIEQKGA